MLFFLVYLFFADVMVVRVIEGRWTAIREVLTGQGKMRHTHTERIVKEIFLLKMQAICRPGNLTNFLGKVDQ